MSSSPSSPSVLSTATLVGGPVASSANLVMPHPSSASVHSSSASSSSSSALPASAIAATSSLGPSVTPQPLNYLDDYELQSDPKYKQYVKQVDSALKGFEYTSEWADLVNALGKLNKVLQNNTKYPVIPRRAIVGQRLAQCMHPALPSGVHLKALETYDLIFKCIGTDRLIQELHIYSKGLFPLLSHAAINVKPALLEIYQTHFVPLGDRLRLALDGFVIAVLPGLEEGSDYYAKTESLLKLVCDGVGREYFYTAIWRCILQVPSVRLSAICFVMATFNKKKSLEDQLYIMGTSIDTLVNGICNSLLDPNVLVQRSILDLLINTFPMHNRQIFKHDMISIITAAVTVLLRRDISLNRRLFAWFRNDLDTIPTKPSRKGDHYFERYSKHLVSQAFVLCLTDPSEIIATPSAWSSLGELWPYRLLICLLDRPEIRKSILDNLSTEVFRALYLESKNECNFGNEMQRTTNLLINNLGLAYTWKRLLDLFSESCCAQHASVTRNLSTNTTTATTTPTTATATTPTNSATETSDIKSNSQLSTVKDSKREEKKSDLETQSSDGKSESNVDQENVQENPAEELVGAILRRKSRKYSSHSADAQVDYAFVANNVDSNKLSVMQSNEPVDTAASGKTASVGVACHNDSDDRETLDESLCPVRPVGSGKLHIREACAIIDFIAQVTESLNDTPESSANTYLMIVLNEIIHNLIFYVKHLDHREMYSMIQLACKITSKIQFDVKLSQAQDCTSLGTHDTPLGNNGRTVNNIPPLGQSQGCQSLSSCSTKKLTSLNASKVTCSPGNASALSINSPLRSCVVEAATDVLQEIREESELESLSTERISPVTSSIDTANLSPVVLADEADEENDAQDASLPNTVDAAVAASSANKCVSSDSRGKDTNTSNAPVNNNCKNSALETEESAITAVKRISKLFSAFVRERFVINTLDGNESSHSPSCLIHSEKSDSWIDCAADCKNTRCNLDSSANCDRNQRDTDAHSEKCNSCFMDKMFSRLVNCSENHANAHGDFNLLSPVNCNALNSQSNKVNKENDGNGGKSNLSLDLQLVPAYTSLCQLLIRASLMPKAEAREASEKADVTGLHHSCGIGLPMSRDTPKNEQSQCVGSAGSNCPSLTTWLTDLLVLSCFTSSSSIEVTYCSISTFLSLLEITKIERVDVKMYLTLSSILMKNDRIQSPLLEFIVNGNSSSGHASSRVNSGNNSSASSNVRNSSSYCKSSANCNGNDASTCPDKSNGKCDNCTDTLNCLTVACFLEYNAVQFVTNNCTYYTRVANLLWNFLSDEFSELHHETAWLIQRIHDATDDSTIVESVICSNMASNNKCVSYEARKRFSTLYNITRDYHRKHHHQHYLQQSNVTSNTANNTAAAASVSTNGNASSTADASSSHPPATCASPSSASSSSAMSPLSMLFHHREFDRPLFFMLDSLSEKLDTHNAQAINWLNQCLRSGDVARILEPLLVILLHPDTSRVSVQHVNVQSTLDNNSVSHQSTVSTILDEIVDAVSEKSVVVEDDDDEKSTVSCGSSDNSSSSSSSCSVSSTGRNAVSKLISLNSNLISFNQPISVNQLHSHIILYTQVYDSRRALYSLTTLQNIILRNPSKVLLAMSTTCISNRLGIRSNELQTLCARHRKSLLGRGFYSELDNDSITGFRSSTFLEIVITTCLYYIRSYYSGLPAYSAHLTEDELLGNQKVRILSCEILRLIFSMLIPEIKGKPTFIAYINDMLLRCQVQKVILHSLVSSVYNFQFKSKNESSNNNNNVINNPNCNLNPCDDPIRKLSSSSVDQLIKNSSASDDCFTDTVIELNEKTPNSVGFQEDMQNSLLQLLEQLMILEHESSVNSCNAVNNSDREVPTHNRKGSDARASRIRFQPQMSSLKYCPNVLIPSQPMFLSAVQTALQQTCKASLHANWLELVKASLPYAGRSLTRIVVCVVGQICHNLDTLADMITRYESNYNFESSIYTVPKAEFAMPPNYLISLIKSLSNLCHYVLCDSSNAFGGSFFSSAPTSSNSNANLSSNSSGNSHPGNNSSSIGVISVNPIQTISNILHVFSSDTLLSDSNARNASGFNDSSNDPLVTTKRTLLNHLPRILASLRNIWKSVNQGSSQLFKLDQDTSDFNCLMNREKMRKMSSLSSSSASSFSLHSTHRTSISHSNRSDKSNSSVNTGNSILQGISSNSIYSSSSTIRCNDNDKNNHHSGDYKGWEVMGTADEIRLAILDLLSPISLLHGTHFLNAISFVWYDLRESKINTNANSKLSATDASSVAADTISTTTVSTNLTNNVSAHHKLTSSISVTSVPCYLNTNCSNGQQNTPVVSVIPRCSQDQMILVDLIASIKVLPMDLIIQNVKYVLKNPLETNPTRKKRIASEVSLLQFFLAYIRLHATNDKSHQILECWKSLLSLIKDGLSASQQKPLAMFHLLAILHEFVSAAPLIEDRRDQKDLQDIAQRLVDACTTVAGARLAQTRWIGRRNLEVRPGPMESNHDDETDGETSEPSPGLPPSRSDTVSTTGSISSSSVTPNSNSANNSDHHHNSSDDHSSFLAKFSVQALNALAEFVATILDVVYVSEEKEKVVPLVSSIIYYVTPYLKNHSKHNAPSFMAGSHLLASITGYQYSRKAWRKEAFELLLDTAFFQMESGCLIYWKVIVDHLMTHDKTTFRDFLSRMSMRQSSVTLFSSKDQEHIEKGHLAKRLAFIIFCSEKDQYQRYMPEIQEKLIECLRMNSSPFLQSQILLCFRVLLIRMSHHHLTSLWPFIFTEMSQAFQQIEMELHSNPPELKRTNSGSQLYKSVTSESWSSSGILGSSSSSSLKDPAWLQLYLYACKLLDLALTLPADELPQFQMHKWAFVGDAYGEESWYANVRGGAGSSAGAGIAGGHSCIATPASSPLDPFIRMSESAALASMSAGERSSLTQGSPTAAATNASLPLKSPSPSPTPSRNSFTGSSLSVASSATITSNVTALTSVSGIRNTMTASPVICSFSVAPFESHVVRIEKTMRIKDPIPEVLPYVEGRPLLTLTSIKSIYDLHPFFYTLVRATSHAGKASPGSYCVDVDVNNSIRPRLIPCRSIIAVDEDVDPLYHLDRILERDFLEESNASPAPR